MAVFTGTGGNNVITGTALDDTISGLGGDDSLSGGAGNDTLNGGEGTDSLDGEAGNDILNGDGGDDILSDSHGTNVLNGGDGNDLIVMYDGDGAINAGSGNDRVWLYQTHYDVSHTFNFDLGTGDDIIQFSDVTGLTITGGAGHDIYDPVLVFDNIAGTVITDFEVGPDGDVIKLDDLFANTDYTGVNPFGDGPLSLAQSGDDVLLQWQGNTLITLQNVQLNDLTRDNFGGMPTDGSTPAARSISGTAYDDVIDGSAGADTIDGLSGDDVMTGSFGNDTLNGGDGIDQLNGGLGDDILNGGDGDDFLYDPNGSNQYYGGNGHDIITAYSGGYVDAGAGDDWVNNYDGNVTVKLGDGNDTIFFYAVNDLIITGGAGRDTYDPAARFFGMSNITITDFQGGVAGDLIKLDDMLSEESWSGINPFADGLLRLVQFGKDVLLQMRDYTIITLQNVNIATLTSANFSGFTLNTPLFLGTADADKLTGTAGADIMQGGLGNDVYYINSFQDQVIEAKGEGTDTVISSVQYIMGGSYVENATLTGTLNSYAVGNALDNILFGNSGNNNLTGGIGNDRLDGGGGADGLRGGVGNDTYYVDNLGDFILEAKDEGTDLVYSTVSFNLGAQYVENLTLKGTDNINGLGNALVNIITGNSGDNLLDGRAGADTLIGGLGNDTYYVDNAGDKVIEAKDQGTDSVYSSVTFAMGGQYIENLYLTGTGNINGTGTSQANTLVGNAGKNTLTGGVGNDTLTGGGGADIFFFGAGSGKDTITDFSASQNDSLNLHAYNQATAVISQVGNDTVIDLGGGNIITLAGTLKADVVSHITW